MEKGTLDPGMQLERYEALPEEEVALCCCEYIDERGAKRHLLQTFCDCAELDGSIDEGIDSRELWNTVNAVDRRIRLPAWNGAKHVGFAFVFAAATAGVLYILLSISISFSLVVLCILPILMYRISRMILRAFPRTRFFYFLSYCCVVMLILCVLSTTSERFYIGKCVSLIAFCAVLRWLLNKIRKSSNVSSDVVSKQRNCRICDLMIAHRDHHCIWCYSPSKRSYVYYSKLAPMLPKEFSKDVGSRLNCCISASNDRYFLCFMALASGTLIITALCDVDLITVEMSGAILYRMSLTVLILFVIFAALFMRAFKKSRLQPS